MAALLSESGVVGVVGGREDVPPVVRFVNGFISGASRVNPDINVLSVYNPSFTDPAAGRSAAEQFLGEGADVIFGAGGQTGSGGITAAAEAGAWAIGVDQDEYFTTFGGGSAPGSDRLATSAMKRVDLGVFDQHRQRARGHVQPAASSRWTRPTVASPTRRSTTPPSPTTSRPRSRRSAPAWRTARSTPASTRSRVCPRSSPLH